VFGLVESSIITSHKQNFRTISYLVTVWLQRFATPSHSLDGSCSVGRTYRCAWCVRSRRPHTDATCERRNDANASSEEAVVDVEVDQYIDESSASNIHYSPSFTEAPSIKYSVSNSSQPSRPRTEKI